MTEGTWAAVMRPWVAEPKHAMKLQVPWSWVRLAFVGVGLLALANGCRSPRLQIVLARCLRLPWGGLKEASLASVADA